MILVYFPLLVMTLYVAERDVVDCNWLRVLSYGLVRRDDRVCRVL